MFSHLKENKKKNQFQRQLAVPIHTDLITQQRITCTKFLSKFKIISKLPSVKSSACVSELPGTELEGSVVPINEVGWSAMCETM